jgi:chromosome segregation ATPase
MVRPQLPPGRHDKESTMNAKQQREWEDDVAQPCAFPEPLAEVLTRENRELRGEVERLRDQITAVEGQRDHHLEWSESWFNSAMSAARRAHDAEAELADATTAAQNLRDELQGAQERLRAVVVQTLRDAAQDAVERGDIGKPGGVEAWVWLRAWADQLETDPKPPWVVP